MAIMSKEYYADIESVYKKPEDYELAGKGNAYIRIDAEAKVTGSAVYTDDVDLPGMYYCKLVHSPYAHALIKSIDFSEALKLPGVKGVLTGADFPEGHNLGNPEAFKELADKEPLCRKKVRMVGDEVAAVCATTEEIATQAAALVKVEYEVLEPVLDPFYSMQPDAPAIHYPGTSNLSIFTTMKAGDPDKVFAEADYTDKHYYRTQEMVHAAIEPHGAVAKYENNEWTVWTTTQGAYVSRYWIAWGLGVPESQVRVIKPMLGGGFGGKLDVFAHELCPCKFAQMTGHPVKCILKRDEVFMCTRTRHPISFEIESAFTKEGKLLAKRCKHILDGGAYGGSGIAANTLSLICATFPYKVENIDMTARRPYTNHPASGAMRGYSACQVHFADLAGQPIAEVSQNENDHCAPIFVGFFVIVVIRERQIRQCCHLRRQQQNMQVKFLHHTDKDQHKAGEETALGKRGNDPGETGQETCPFDRCRFFQFHSDLHHG